MKIKNLYLILLIAAVTACKNEQAIKNQAHLKVNGITGREVSVSRMDLLGMEFEKLADTKVDSGVFEQEIEISHSTFASLEVNGTQIPIYLAPGFDLQIDISADNQISFCGKGAPINNYLKTSSQISLKYNRSGGKFFNQLDPVAFLSRFDSLKNSLQELHLATVDSKDISKESLQDFESMNRSKFIFFDKKLFNAKIPG